MGDFGNLIARAKLGEDDAVAELYTLYSRRVAPRVRERLAGRLRRYYETADITHSVFADVLRGLAEFEDRGEAAFVHWLCLKAENKVRDKYRRHMGPGGQRRQTTLDAERADAMVSRADTPGAAAARSDEARHLLGALDPVDAEVVRLRAEKQLPFATIAARQGLPSAEAARKRYARAIVALRTRSREV